MSNAQRTAIDDMNVAGTLCLKGLNGYPGIRLMDSADNVVGEVVHTGTYTSLKKYTIDLSGQPSSNFYFIEFAGVGQIYVCRVSRLTAIM